MRRLSALLLALSTLLGGVTALVRTIFDLRRENEALYKQAGDEVGAQSDEVLALKERIAKLEREHK